ncbi:beta-ketoacyl synthase N-terminal-like domain-containing protein [Streptomyces sp. SP18CS02]|uniref:beta-ketoacyl synthase N-terminal-like domain-containing protein n=1 Tax=Streptomyces sp. SP18CS02 TaxID=3002531 RepID=UPI002E7872D5|nr:beta-ketoacyl synthase N-terminal-like domain-containing protein [Streptomyces sp. SP18CS02]MEE1757214.1 beta-ketoacyl synthase N-terminal-like domain-containing protein [Streptomyces sp. SP18CS02]
MTDVPEGAIAIVGMSGRFPGAPDLAAYWANLRDGVCSLTGFSADELLADGADEHEVGHPDHVPVKGHLAGADRFEAGLFGFNRTEAAALDPQHRLLLETAWGALEDAGYDPLHGPARTGVYVGGSLTEHMLAAATDPGLAARVGAMQVRILTDREFLAPWVSYRLGLDGPSLTVQTACSTSLTAVHLAVQALLLGECDTALAGGAAVDSVRRRGYVHYEGGIFSPDGRCRPFDEKAGGTVPGNGVGVVVLRRLEDALADGDPVRAVIRGTAVTNDGATKVGFTAPGVDQQTAAIVEAWSAAGLDPARAQYLEAHGTGTELGDRIELAAAKAAFGDAPGLRIGSVKSNIGHLDAAAGVAALIKAVLMLQHGTLAPTVNVTSPSAAPFTLVDRTVPWPAPEDGGPRLAGVTSVGIGGTNVHLVLAEAPGRPVPDGDQGPLVLPLSASTPEQLGAVEAALAAALRADDAPRLADVAHTLRTGRGALPVRSYVVARDAAEAAAKLAAGTRDADPLGEAWLAGEDVVWPRVGPDAGTAPAGAVRRVNLPAYPFAGESHGALSLVRDRARPSGQEPSALATAGAAEAGPDRTGGRYAPDTPGAADGDGTGAGPVPDVEAAVGEVLREALGLDDVPGALDRTYFEAGGDSLTAVHLVGRMRDEFGVDVPIDLFLEQLTLAELAARVTALRSGDDELDALLAEFESEA